MSKTQEDQKQLSPEKKTKKMNNANVFIIKVAATQQYKIDRWSCYKTID